MHSSLISVISRAYDTDSISARREALSLLGQRKWTTQSYDDGEADLGLLESAVRYGLSGCLPLYSLPPLVVLVFIAEPLLPFGVGAVAMASRPARPDERSQLSRAGELFPPLRAVT